MLHQSENVVRAQAKATATRKARKYTVVGAIAAVLVLPIAAYAAITLFGFGEVSASAADVKPLTITDISLTGSLIPGTTVGSKGVVHNSNDFPVVVSAVITRAEGLSATGDPSCSSTVHPVGTYNANQGPGVGAGWRQSIAPVTVPANGAVWVNVPQAVSQDDGATELCGFTAKIAVQASAGN